MQVGTNKVPFRIAREGPRLVVEVRKNEQKPGSSVQRLAQILLLGPPLMMFLQSLAFLLTQFHLPRSVARVLYPQLGTLQEHCASVSCLYDPLGVSSLYAIQMLTGVFWIFLQIGIRVRQANGLRTVDYKRILFCCFVTFATGFEYIAGNFAFNPSSLMPNDVTTSITGIFRYAVYFSVVSWFWLAGLGIFKRKGQEDAGS